MIPSAPIGCSTIEMHCRIVDQVFYHHHKVKIWKHNETDFQVADQPKGGKKLSTTSQTVRSCGIGSTSIQHLAGLWLIRSSLWERACSVPVTGSANSDAVISAADLTTLPAVKEVK